MQVSMDERLTRMQDDIKEVVEMLEMLETEKKEMFERINLVLK